MVQRHRRRIEPRVITQPAVWNQGRPCANTAATCQTCVNKKRAPPTLSYSHIRGVLTGSWREGGENPSVTQSSLHRPSAPTIEQFMRWSFRTTSITEDLHFAGSDFLNVVQVMGRVMALTPEQETETVSLMDDLVRLSDQTEFMVGALIGWSTEFRTQSLYEAFCTLFMMRHTNVGSGFRVYLKIPVQGIAGEACALIQQLMEELLHQILLLTQVQEGDEYGKCLFRTFLIRCPDVRNCYLRPLVAFLWNHRKKVLTGSQMAAYGACCWTRRRIPKLKLDTQRWYFGLAASTWIHTNLDLILFMAAHTTAHNEDHRDECYRGTREVLRAGQSVLWSDFAVYNQLADNMMELIKGIETEGWYDNWKEWWHHRDIWTTDPKTHQSL